ncbi:MAG: hypothetical protein H6843_05635 [Rhodospirillaceae bacterium]|nr:hypothetical protein [Rhodospirillaceae bacterium]
MADVAVAIDRAIRAQKAFADVADKQPRDDLERAGMQMGLVTDAEAAALDDVLKDRNLGIHAYDPSLAEAIKSRLPGHRDLLATWLNGLEQRMAAQ